MSRRGWVPASLPNATPEEQRETKPVSLCNACGLLYSRQWFCPYCRTVYRRQDSESKAPQPLWISCCFCPAFVHFQCEWDALQDAEPFLAPNYACWECRQAQRAAKAGKSAPRPRPPVFNPDASLHTHLPGRPDAPIVLHKRPFLKAGFEVHGGGGGGTSAPVQPAGDTSSGGGGGGGGKGRRAGLPASTSTAPPRRTARPPGPGSGPGDNATGSPASSSQPRALRVVPQSRALLHAKTKAKTHQEELQGEPQDGAAPVPAQQAHEQHAAPATYNFTMGSPAPYPGPMPLYGLGFPPMTGSGIPGFFFPNQFQPHFPVPQISPSLFLPQAPGSTGGLGYGSLGSPLMPFPLVLQSSGPGYLPAASPATGPLLHSEAEAGSPQPSTKRGRFTQQADFEAQDPPQGATYTGAAMAAAPLGLTFLSPTTSIVVGGVTGSERGALSPTGSPGPPALDQYVSGPQTQPTSPLLLSAEASAPGSPVHAGPAADIPSAAPSARIRTRTRKGAHPLRSIADPEQHVEDAALEGGQGQGHGG